MIREGEQAPSFELPAVIEGRPGRIALDDVVGESVVVLVFYPADFNPSCTDETTDLDEFDVFRMQPDAAVLAVSGDSVYSHRAFAEAYGLQIPLLADVHGEVAEAYGVAADDDRYRNHRAVVVIDHDGTVTYTWLASDIEDRPDIRAVQQAFGAIGDTALATTEYSEGCDHYERGRDAFLEGMAAYEERDWVLACGAFEDARDALLSAAERFRRAIRFSEDEAMARSFERGQTVADELRLTVGVLNDAAAAHAGGDPSHGEALRREAEENLEHLRDLGAPPGPDDIPVDEDSPADQSPFAIDGVLSGAGVTEGGDGTSDGEDGPIDDEELAALTESIETQDASDPDAADAEPDDS